MNRRELLTAALNAAVVAPVAAAVGLPAVAKPIQWPNVTPVDVGEITFTAHYDAIAFAVDGKVVAQREIGSDRWVACQLIGGEWQIVSVECPE